MIDNKVKQYPLKDRTPDNFKMFGVKAGITVCDIIEYLKTINRILKLKKKSIFYKISEMSDYTKKTLFQIDHKYTINTLIVYGEKDEGLSNSRQFWKRYHLKNNNLLYQEQIVRGANHSFFGWYFKRDVCETIVKWLT